MSELPSAFSLLPNVYSSCAFRQAKKGEETAAWQNAARLCATQLATYKGSLIHGRG
jgi:hypothetical protein